MTNELRLIDYSVFYDKDFIDNLKKIREQFEIISLGSESCYRQLPSLTAVKDIIQILKEFKIKLLIPTAFESHLDKVKSYVDLAIKEKVDYLCVNDYGILNYINEKYGPLKDTKIVIGNGLSYSIEYVPWHEHFFDGEPENLKEYLLKSNIDNAWTFEFFKKHFSNYKFGVEIAATPHVLTSIDNLLANQIEIDVLADLVPVSYTRCCHTARYYGKTPQNCGRPCRELLITERTHRWQKQTKEVVEIPPEIRKIIPSLYVWGNATFYKTPIENILPYRDRIANIIYDYRFYNDVFDVIETSQKIAGRV